jgi:hypothetical protein
MFITGQRRATRNGQRARGRFLILMQPEDIAIGEISTTPVRALVRYVEMAQIGHFMMGTLTLKGHAISLSGAYGHDGLILDVPREVYDMGVELPADLREAWNKGGGHNSAGSEGPAMKAWALATFPARGRAAGHHPEPEPEPEAPRP